MATKKQIQELGEETLYFISDYAKKTGLQENEGILLEQIYDNFAGGEILDMDEDGFDKLRARAESRGLTVKQCIYQAVTNWMEANPQRLI